MSNITQMAEAHLQIAFSYLDIPPLVGLSQSCKKLHDFFQNRFIYEKPPLKLTGLKQRCVVTQPEKLLDILEFTTNPASQKLLKRFQEAKIIEIKLHKEQTISVKNMGDLLCLFPKPQIIFNSDAIPSDPPSKKVRPEFKDPYLSFFDMACNILAVQKINIEMLIEACKNGCLALVCFILSKNKSLINLQDMEKITPLEWTIIKEENSTACMLLKWGADPNTIREEGDTPLIDAIYRDNEEMVETLLAYKADVNAMNCNKEPPLWYAAQSGNINILEILLKAKADPNIPDMHKITPLEQAIIKKQNAAACMLLEWGADPNTISEEEHTPLIRAIYNDNKKMVKKLLAYKANVNAVNCNKETPLWHAVQSGNINILEILLKAKADPNIPDTRNPLQEAVLNGKCYNIKLLDTLDCTNKKHKTNHNISFSELYFKIAKMLLAHGSDPNALNDKDEPPLYTAASIGHLPLVKLLLDHGANPKIGKSPLAVAKDLKSNHFFDKRNYQFSHNFFHEDLKEIIRLLEIFSGDPS